jgi:predicted nucleotidyltransferase
VSTFAHLSYLGIAKNTTLDSLGVKIPNLDSNFAESKELLQSETAALEQLIRAIGDHPELSQHLYPTVILFGSRIKGYGTSTADLDYAVLVKPGTSETARAQIQALLQQSTSQSISGKAVEFWLEADNDKLVVKDFNSPDVSLADSTWAHVLFEGVWYGDKSAIEELHEKLLTSYLYSQGKKYGTRDARHTWLEEMEKDTLQYRLMHKGYARYYPKQGRLATAHSKFIDGDATFYDSGYRRLATKLFVRKVFLPKL